MSFIRLLSEKDISIFGGGLQTDLDEWISFYNNDRTHQECFVEGRQWGASLMAKIWEEKSDPVELSPDIRIIKMEAFLESSLNYYMPVRVFIRGKTISP